MDDRPLEWWEEIQVTMLGNLDHPKAKEFAAYWREHPAEFRAWRSKMRQRAEESRT